jgi:hypothetical protein
MSPDGGHSCPEGAVKQQAVETEAARLASALDVVLGEAGDAQRYHEPGALDRPALQTISDAIDLLEALPQALTAARQQAVPPPLDTRPVQWRRPSWAGKRRSPEELAQVSDEQLAQWRQEDAECEAHNQAEKKRREGQRRQARQLLEAIYGKGSRQVKYFDKEVPAYGPPHSFVLEIEAPVKEARKKQEALNKAAQRKAEAKRLRQEAANWLLERGRKLGADFAYEDALETANEIAFDEEVARREEAGKNGTWYEFDGDNYCENCEGWDGHSHRCQCGNRRVSWTQGYEHNFKNPEVYAEAY